MRGTKGKLMLLLILNVCCLINIFNTTKREINVPNRTLYSMSSNLSIKTEIKESGLIDDLLINKDKININIIIKDNIEISKLKSNNKSNVTSELTNDRLNEILSYDLTSWIIYDINDDVYLNYKNYLNILTDDFKPLTIHIKDTDIYFGIIKSNDKYTLIDTPVKVATGDINSLKSNQYVDLETAIKFANDGDYIIINKDINIDSPITLNKNLTITSDPNDAYTITASSDYAFILDKTSDINKTINIYNINFDVNSFIYANKKTTVSKIYIKDKVSIFYHKELCNKKKIIIGGDNNTFKQFLGLHK